jgi:hypothetical protein
MSQISDPNRLWNALKKSSVSLPVSITADALAADKEMIVWLC